MDDENKSQKKSSSSGINMKTILIILGVLITGVILGVVIPKILPGGSRSDDTGITPEDIVDLTSQDDDENVAIDEDIVTDTDSNEEVLEYDITTQLGEMPQDSETAYIEYMVEFTGEDRGYLASRWELAQKFIETEELQGHAIEGFLRTPREHFVREKNIANAYADTWMPIGYGATITDPDVVSMMTTTLDLQPHHKVLEIGTGSGYQSAILSNISNYVYSIEIIEPLYHETNELQETLEEDYPQYSNIHRKMGDGYYGWEKYAPFDRIIITCSIDHLPPPLLQQLNVGGIMCVPLGPPGRQYIMEIKKTVDENGDIQLTRRDVYNGMSVKFIPFRDDEGSSYSGR